MKRELEREERLPAFDLKPGDLELLWTRVLSVFEATSAIKTRLTLSMPSERIEFDSMEEFRSYGQLRGRITNFTLRVSQGDRSVLVRTGGLFNSIPTVKVEAESDLWCASAVEAVMAVIRANRVWYGWFIYAPIFSLFFLFSLTPMAVSWFFPKMEPAPRPVVIAWVIAVFLLAFLSYAKEKLLPAASITFTNELGFIRRYGSELGLLLGVVALILTVYTML